MWRALLLLASVPAIPRNCDPPPEAPTYACRALPAELDLGEVETFTRKTRLLGLDNRDRLELSPVSEPFDVRQTIQFQSLALAVDFTPRDAKLHVQELKVRPTPSVRSRRFGSSVSARERWRRRAPSWISASRRARNAWSASCR